MAAHRGDGPGLRTRALQAATSRRRSRPAVRPFFAEVAAHHSHVGVGDGEVERDVRGVVPLDQAAVIEFRGGGPMPADQSVCMATPASTRLRPPTGPRGTIPGGAASCPKHQTHAAKAASKVSRPTWRSSGWSRSYARQPVVGDAAVEDSRGERDVAGNSAGTPAGRNASCMQRLRHAGSSRRRLPSSSARIMLHVNRQTPTEAAAAGWHMHQQERLEADQPDPAGATIDAIARLVSCLLAHGRQPRIRPTGRRCCS